MNYPIQRQLTESTEILYKRNYDRLRDMFHASGDFIGDALYWIEHSNGNPQTRNTLLTALIHHHPELRGKMQYLRDKMDDEIKQRLYATRGKADSLPSVKKLLADVLKSDLSALDKFFVYLHVRFPERWNFWFGTESMNKFDGETIIMNDYKTVGSYGSKTINLDTTAKKLFKELSEMELSRMQTESRDAYMKRVSRAMRKIHPDLAINTIRKRWNEELRNSKTYKNLIPDDQDAVHERLMSQNARTGATYYR